MGIGWRGTPWRHRPATTRDDAQHGRRARKGALEHGVRANRLVQSGDLQDRHLGVEPGHQIADGWGKPARRTIRAEVERPSAAFVDGRGEEDDPKVRL